VRTVQTSLSVGDSTDAIDPRLLGVRCVGERLVALARAAAAMHMALAAERLSGSEGSGDGEAGKVGS